MLFACQVGVSTVWDEVDSIGAVRRQVRLRPAKVRAQGPIVGLGGQPPRPIDGGAQLVGVEWAPRGLPGAPDTVVLIRRDGMVRVLEVGQEGLLREKEQWRKMSGGGGFEDEEPELRIRLGSLSS